MSTEIEHAHAFPTPRNCDCGMSFEEFLYRQNGGNRTVGMRLDPLSGDFPREITRAIIIDWRSQVIPGAVMTDQVALSDAETGEPILTGTELHVHARLGYYVVAELVTLADADGNPILDGEINNRISIAEDGTFATVTTWWHVAEMRVGK